MNRPYDRQTAVREPPTMKFDPAIHHRRSIRFRGYDYSQPGAYYLTLCTHEKEHLFGEIAGGEMKRNECGEIVRQGWEDFPRRYPAVQVDSFVVMPNHIHGILLVGAIHELPQGDFQGATRESPQRQFQRAVHEPPLRRRMLLPKLIGYLKMTTSKRINEIRGTPGSPVWQRNYYEHIIRNEDELGKIREYVATNPVQWLADPENADRDTDLDEVW